MRRIITTLFALLVVLAMGSAQAQTSERALTHTNGFEFQGKAAGPVIEDNTRRWSGDHCLDPRHVPGVLFCSRPLGADRAHITDIAPTVLALFGVGRPGYMQGRSLLDDGEGESAGNG